MLSAVDDARPALEYDGLPHNRAAIVFYDVGQRYGVRVSGDTVIDARDLAAGYTGTLILDGVDVGIQRGVVTCIVGGSGCGKSTLLRAAVGLLAPRRGDVRLLGEDLYALGEDERSALLGRVGLMFQYGALLNSLSIAENMAIPMRAHTRLDPAVIDTVIRMKLGLVHLQAAGAKLPGELSGGMRKRAGLARAIALDPELLLCDEPTAGLDPNTAADLDQLLLQLKKLLGMTLVVVTHELNSIRTIADRIVMLRDARVHFHGSLTEALESDDKPLRDFFHRESSAVERPGRSLYHQVARVGREA